MKTGCPPHVPRSPVRSPLRRQLKSSVHTRALLNLEQARALEVIFKTLANATRLRLLHLLICSPELRVTQIAETLGMKLTTVSNQLQKLADQGILASAREGQTIRYRLVDPCVLELLATGWCLAEDTAIPRSLAPFAKA